ncbi:MAG: hypothetical protein II047_05630, partial [Bacteroidales bacterium]|nr:hypothetical protein [Bacteroidales bacterium]
TRIAQGQAYWEQFVEKWPTVQDLAKASEDEVLRCWQGLGYYSRARNLKKAAVQLVEQYGGRLPETAEELRRLPGIGDYTAGAIASNIEKIHALDSLLGLPTDKDIEMIQNQIL